MNEYPASHEHVYVVPDAWQVAPVSPPFAQGFRAHGLAAGTQLPPVDA